MKNQKLKKIKRLKELKRQETLYATIEDREPDYSELNLPKHLSVRHKIKSYSKPSPNWIIYDDDI